MPLAMVGRVARMCSFFCVVEETAEVEEEDDAAMIFLAATATSDFF